MADQSHNVKLLTAVSLLLGIGIGFGGVRLLHQSSAPAVNMLGMPAMRGNMNRLALPMTPGRTRFMAPPVRAGIQEDTVASRYAAGLFELAKDKDLGSLYGDVESLQLTLNEVPELAQTLSNPLTPEADKRSLIDKMLEKGTMNTMCNYLVDKQRVNLLPEILGGFETLYNEQQGIQQVAVKSACQMTEEQLLEIAKTVKDRTGAKAVKIKETVDDKLMGGFVVSYGGQTIDLSIRTGLERIRQELEGSVSLSAR
jgi:F-type H+-transporting ATPase subunit delta